MIVSRRQIFTRIFNASCAVDRRKRSVSTCVLDNNFLFVASRLPSILSSVKQYIYYAREVFLKYLN